MAICATFAFWAIGCAPSAESSGETPIALTTTAEYLYSFDDPPIYEPFTIIVSEEFIAQVEAAGTVTLEAGYERTELGRLLGPFDVGMVVDDRLELDLSRYSMNTMPGPIDLLEAGQPIDVAWHREHDYPLRIYVIEVVTLSGRVLTEDRRLRLPNGQPVPGTYVHRNSAEATSPNPSAEPFWEVTLDALESGRDYTATFTVRGR